MLYVQYVELMYYMLKPFMLNYRPLFPMLTDLKPSLCLFLVLLLLYDESLILSQLILLVSSVKSQNCFS